MNATGKSKSEVLLLNDWIVRVQQPENTGTGRIFLMLHGYTGDENSMTVFTRNLPSDAWIFSPRAPYPSISGGYKWISSEQGSSASLKEFQEAGQGIHEAMSNWKESFNLPDHKVEIIGFSQGGVTALSYALSYPEQVKRAACLSGFLPHDTPEFIQGEPLAGMPIFIAHGTQDKTVEYDRARKTAALLKQFGAQITFCDSPVGHRISASCFRGLGDFFSGVG